MTATPQVGSTIRFPTSPGSPAGLSTVGKSPSVPGPSAGPSARYAANTRLSRNTIRHLPGSARPVGKSWAMRHGATNTEMITQLASQAAQFAPAHPSRPYRARSA